MTKMNPEIKALWLDALRSGEYKQGRGYLRTSNPGFGDHYCCLGVLCDLAETAGVVRSYVEADDTMEGIYTYSNDIDDEARFAQLPESVVGWSRIGTASGARETGDALWVLNDRWELNFNQIADIIEAEF